MNDTDYKRLWRNAQKEAVMLNNTVVGLMSYAKENMTKEDFEKFEQLADILKGIKK